MLVTNQTNETYWFGPLALPAGVGQTLTVDDTSETSLYLTDDSIAATLNNLYIAGKIAVSGEAQPFPRPTGVPQLLHGDGSPEGLVYAPQGSAFMRRDNSGGSSTLYVKTTGVTISTGWQALSTAAIAVPTGIIHAYGGSTAPDDWLLCDGTAVSRTIFSDLFAVVGTAFGAGDGSTTFNVPDLRGRVAVGYAASGGHVDVSTLGNNDGVAEANRRPKHNHTVGNQSVDHTHSGTTGGQSVDHTHSGTTGGESADHTHAIDAEPQGTIVGGAPEAWMDGSPTGGRSTGGSSNGHTHDFTTSGASTGHTHSFSTGGESVSHTHVVGPGGTTAVDTPAYLVLNHIIKT